MKHKQELIDILMNDAKLQYEYADKEGNTCAIGGIAVAFGWHGQPIRGEGNKQGINHKLTHKNRNPMMVAVRKAQKHFNLTDEQLVLLQKTNDSFVRIDPRHLALKKLVESWEEE